MKSLFLLSWRWDLCNSSWMQQSFQWIDQQAYTVCPEALMYTNSSSFLSALESCVLPIPQSLGQSQEFWTQSHICDMFVRCFWENGGAENVLFGDLWVSSTRTPLATAIFVVMNPQRAAPFSCSERFASAPCFAFQLYCSGSFSPLISNISSSSRLLFSAKSSDKPTVHYLPCTKQQTDTVSSKLVNIAAKETDIFLRSLLTPPKKRAKWEWILDLHSSGGQKHESKWLLILLPNCWMCN